jgi:hypothetical protein
MFGALPLTPQLLHELQDWIVYSISGTFALMHQRVNYTHLLQMYQRR